MALNPDQVRDLHQSMKTQLETWMKIKLAIQRGFRKDPLTKEHENQFIKLKSDLSRLYRVIGDQLPKDLSFDGDEMIDLLKSATTMTHLQTLPLSEKKNIFSRWHKIYVMMTRTFGAFEVMNEGYYPQLHRDLMKPKPIKKTKAPGRK